MINKLTYPMDLWMVGKPIYRIPDVNRKRYTLNRDNSGWWGHSRLDDERINITASNVDEWAYTDNVFEIAQNAAVRIMAMAEHVKTATDALADLDDSHDGEWLDPDIEYYNRIKTSLGKMQAIIDGVKAEVNLPNTMEALIKDGANRAGWIAKSIGIGVPNQLQALSIGEIFKELQGVLDGVKAEQA